MTVSVALNPGRSGARIAVQLTAMTDPSEMVTWWIGGGGLSPWTRRRLRRCVLRHTPVNVIDVVVEPLVNGWSSTHEIELQCWIT